ncbi:MAG: alanine/glycine:cation symporter family protein [Myxococcota bacterium]|nr:alanine/glycine:cation symporter family protein [Myxococcota bacterium]
MHLLAPLLLAAPAFAQETAPEAPAPEATQAAEAPPPEAPASFGDRADAAFGKWVVGPLASVMFFDLYRGDETLDVDPKHVGKVVDGRQILGIEGEHFVLAPVVELELPQAFPMYPELELQGDGPARWGYLSREADHVPYTLLVVQETEISAEQAGELVPLSAFDGALKAEPRLSDEDAHFVSTALAPFPLVLAQTRSTSEDTGAETSPDTVDPSRPLRVLPLELPAPEQRPELSIGGSILTLQGPAKVLSIDGDQVIAQTGPAAVETEPVANTRAITLPVVVVWLVLGAIFFTLRMNFINLRGVGHAISVTKGDYDNEEDEGEISHFQALSSALSATVGLGNIAGVAVAVAAGGPGAIFWMIVAGFLGMSSKFAECTLGQMYRVTDANGNVSGGPMRYLSAGLQEKGMGGLGKVLAVMFALMCVGGSFGGGNMFQSNQSYQAVADVVPVLAPKAEGEVRFERTRAEVDVVVPKKTALTVGDHSYVTLKEVTVPAGELSSPPVKVRALQASEASNLADGAALSVSVVGVSGAVATGEIDGGAAPRAWLYGLIISFVVGLVIIGGIKSIGKVAGVIVPVMTGVYVLAAIWILVANADQIGAAFGTIVGGAFTMKAGFGGLLGTLIQGFRRAAFSNEAGVGSASIAHSAASTDEPVREGIVALLEPLIDTIIVCTMTGLVVVITGVYESDVGDGVLMTSAAFESVLDWFPLILSLAVVLFAFSTMISWSYYGERSWTFLFGARSSMVYKLLFLFFAFLGSVIKLQSVLDFSDLMILGMAFPNILGVALLSGKVRAALDDYWGRLKRGEMKPVN